MNKLIPGQSEQVESALNEQLLEYYKSWISFRADHPKASRKELLLQRQNNDAKYSGLLDAAK
jgi:hypothetical protein